MRIHLLKLNLMLRNGIARPIEDDEPRARRALINGADVEILRCLLGRRRSVGRAAAAVGLLVLILRSHYLVHSSPLEVT